MQTNQKHECLDSSEEDPVFKIEEKYQNHPSVKLIKAKNKNKSLTFMFTKTNIDEIKKSIQNLDLKKASQKRGRV